MTISRDLILSHFCLPSADFPTRVEAARTSGCTGIGLWISEYQKLRESGLSDDELSRILADFEIGLPEIEVLTGWGGDENERAQAKSRLDVACHMADQFGSKYLQIIGPYKGTLEWAAEKLHHVCQRAKAHGLEISVEFLPITNIGNLAEALELVSMTGNDNIGICLDTWHFFRGGNELSELKQLKQSDINLLQMNDGSLKAEDNDYIRDCLTNRRVFGDGEFPLVPFMEAINTLGYGGPVSIEIMSSDLDTQPANTAATAMTHSFQFLNPLLR